MNQDIAHWGLMALAIVIVALFKTFSPRGDKVIDGELSSTYKKGDSMKIILLKLILNMFTTKAVEELTKIGTQKLAKSVKGGISNDTADVLIENIEKSKRNKIYDIAVEEAEEYMQDGITKYKTKLLKSV